MTTLEWLAFFVLLIAALAAGAAATLSNGLLARAVRRLEQTYRREKSLELEQLQAQTVARRQAELEDILIREDGWRDVVRQLLADALPSEHAPASGGDGWVTLVDVLDSPPGFIVGRQDGRGETYLFTTSPSARRKDFRGPVIPLDAALSPTARVEAEAVWRCLATRRNLDPQVLPRQAGWYVVAQLSS